MLEEKDPAEIAELYEQHAKTIGEQIAALRREIPALLDAGDKAGAERKRQLMLSLRAQHRQHRDAAKRYRRQGPLVEPHGRSTHVTPMERW